MYELRKLFRRPGNLTDNKIELVLQLETGLAGRDGYVVCKYYFVNHAKRILFWHHPYVKLKDNIFDGMRVHNLGHIGVSYRTNMIDCPGMN